jgi:hypothetical protein
MMERSARPGLAVDGLPGDGAECFLRHNEIDPLHREQLAWWSDDPQTVEEANANPEVFAWPVPGLPTFAPRGAGRRSVR